MEISSFSELFKDTPVLQDLLCQQQTLQLEKLSKNPVFILD